MVNRTMQLARRSARSAVGTRSGQLDADAVNDLVESEKRLAEITRELGDFLRELANDRFELLYQAEDSMLASATSLAEPDFKQGTTQQKEALVYLIKARDKIKQLLAKCDPNAMQAFRKFDRTQLQKLRRPQDKDEQAAELAARLRQLSSQEQIVYATLSGVKLADAASQPDGQKPEKQDQPGQNGPEGSPGQEGSSTTDDGSPKTAEKRSGGQPGEMSRGEVERLQRDIVDEAYDVAAIMEGIEELSELAATRMDRATKQALQASSALARGDPEEAAQAAGGAVPMFEELARHVEGLLGPEAAQRIAAARDISAALARQERDLGDAVPAGKQPASPARSPSSRSKSGQKGQAQQGKGAQGKGQQGEGQGGQGGTQGRPGADPGDGQRSRDSDPAANLPWARRAARLAETGRTLENLLEALANAQDRADGDVATQIERLIREGKVTVTVGQMQQLESLLLAGRLSEARASTGEIAERLEAVSQRLDTLYRSIVAPRLGELIALEKRAAELREGLGKLSSQTEISEWHRQAEAFTRDLAGRQAGGDAAGGLLEAMQAAGWGGGARTWSWRRVGLYYAGPAGYDSQLNVVVQELQDQIRELLLSDMIAAGDEAVPPEYEKLVELYFQVLSQSPNRR